MNIVLRFVAILLLLATAHAKEPPTLTNSPAPIILEDFKLIGDLRGDQATFTLTATARVENPKGGLLDLLSGSVALTEISPHPKWRIKAGQNRFSLSFDRDGKFPIQIKFNAAVRQNE